MPENIVSSNYPHNVLMITLDSCRYDTALKARTPYLDKISKLRLSETPGSYTYPAHHSFFIGNLPRPIDGESTYFGGYNQIWRSRLARTSDKSSFLDFDTANIIDYYKKNGSNIVGFGGVSFFDTNNPNNQLPKYFPEFFYGGGKAGLSIQNRIPRARSAFPLNDIEHIIKKVQGPAPYFIFINEIATHIPYDYPDCDIEEKYEKALEKLYKEQYSTHTIFYPVNELPLNRNEIDTLKKKQIEALEWADKKIGELLYKLPMELPLLCVVMADHGDEFGESGRFGHAHVSDEVMKVPLWAGIINTK